MSENPFLKRVLEKVPGAGDRITEYLFKHWSVPGKPTDEALGVLPVPGVDAEKFMTRVMDIDHYVGPIPHVVVSRSVQDARFAAPEKLRLYQRIKIPVLGDVHQEVLLQRFGQMSGYEVAAWTLLEPETDALAKETAIRCSYNDGAWLVAPGFVAYALSSAPKREDVGFLKWKALTAGADAAAPKVIRDTIGAMAKWAATS